MKNIFTSLLFISISFAVFSQSKTNPPKKVDSLKRSQIHFFKTLNRFKNTAVTPENFKKHPEIRKLAIWYNLPKDLHLPILVLSNQ